jgi:hypothetical protein
MNKWTRDWRHVIVPAVSLSMVVLLSLAACSTNTPEQAHRAPSLVSHNGLAKQPVGWNTPTVRPSQPLHPSVNPPPTVKASATTSVSASAPASHRTVNDAIAGTATCPTPTLSLRILVIASDGNEADLPAITQELDYLGTPYTVYTAASTPGGLTTAMLGNGCQGNYQGVILTNGQLAYYNGTAWASALSSQEWTNLWTYEANLGVREISWYTYPTADFGFQVPTTAVDTSTTPVQAMLTTQGQATFAYMNPASVVPIQNAYTYLAQPLTDGSTTPLITDAQGDALGALHTTPDGRQTLALTYDSNPNLLHNIVYGYGYINWLTSGLFLGSRHVMLSPQIDDLFIDDDIWTPTTACGTAVDQTGSIYRMTGSDFQQVSTWQHQAQAESLTAGLTLSFAFNGYGTTADAGYTPDTLTPVVKANQRQFYWINHTYDHMELDTVDAATATSELNQNTQIAQQLGLAKYSTSDMVTPSISGLTNPAFLQAAYATGIRYVVSDTSLAGYSNPSPDAGIYNAIQPGILEIPRHPMNLFYNVATPDEWTAEYNCMYASFWGHPLTYAQLIDEESQTLLTYMLRGDIDPVMFHQPNVAAYDGTHSLLGDLLDATLTKYRQYFNLNVVFPTFDSLGSLFTQRMQYNASGVSASVSGNSLTLTAQHTATIPVTGVQSAGAEQYGGQSISSITVQAGQTVTVPLS